MYFVALVLYGAHWLVVAPRRGRPIHPLPFGSFAGRTDCAAIGALRPEARVTINGFPASCASVRPRARPQMQYIGPFACADRIADGRAKCFTEPGTDGGAHSGPDRRADGRAERISQPRTDDQPLVGALNITFVTTQCRS